MSESTGANGRFYMSSETSRQLREAMMNASPLQAIQEEWNGEGVPPVGAECEAVWLEDPDGGSREYEPVFIKGYFGSRSGAQVWFTTREGEDLVVRVGNCSFRPIRSPEEVEQEALKTDLLGILPFCEYTDKQIEEMAQILYVQGYRKPDGEA